MRVLVFLTVVLLVLGSVHTYLWWRLVRGTGHSRRWRGVGALVLAVLALSVPASMVGGRTLSHATVAPLHWVGYLWLALMFYLLVVLLALEPVRAVGRLALRRRRIGPAVRGPAPTAAPPSVTPAVGVSPPASGSDQASGSAGAATAVDQATRPAEPGTGTGPDRARGSAEVGTVPDEGRRLFLARTLALAAGAVAAGTVGYGVTEALGPVGVRRVTITLDKLDPRLDGFRIALLADVHLPRLDGPYLADVVATVNRLDAGLVAVVGDLVDGDVAELGEEAAVLADLRSRHGTFFVTGNHEYYSGVEQWLDFLPTVGVRVLRNERLEVRENGGVLDLAGIDDPAAADVGEQGHGPNLDAALDGRDADRAVVLLAHQPVQWPAAARRGVDLQLSGHTHGGQMWPFHYLVPLQQPVVAGLARRGDSQIYVNRGTGFWGPPVRVGSPSEITSLELRAPR